MRQRLRGAINCRRRGRWARATGQGTIAADLLPAQLPEGPFAVLWTQPLGTGWSSPVVANGVAVVTDRQQGAERVLAFSLADGHPLWQQTRAVDFDPHPVGRRHGNGPKSTPAIDEGRVYSLGISGWLSCHELATGTPVWQIDLPSQYGRHEPLSGGASYVNGTTNVIVPIGDSQGAPVPLFGYTGSPVVIDNKVITSVGGERGGTVMAFDKRTGAEVWHAGRKRFLLVTHRGNGRRARQVIVMTGPRVVGLDVSDGARYFGATRSRFSSTKASARRSLRATLC
ncbi:MAG: PQQ-binding-like beta-propeller repeat protein [Pirellulales bacterium]